VGDTARVEIVTRRAMPEDLDLVLADVQTGFDSYVEFAPPGWHPPVVAGHRDRTAEFLGDSGTWALIAHADEQPAGHVAFFQARSPSAAGTLWRDWEPILGLAHLWQLFVRPPWWGRGVAPLLHDAAIAQMKRSGYERARLFTPSRHARARRFYERRGWTATADAWNDELALVLTEYVQTLA
jgi:GNAT superfamily N-acetyltransferase